MTSADRKHQDRMDALRLHLQQVHHNSAASGLSNRDAVVYHHGEHHDPGGLRNHDQPPQLHDWRWFGGVDGKAEPAPKATPMESFTATLSDAMHGEKPEVDDLADRLLSKVWGEARALERERPEFGPAMQALVERYGYL